MVFGVFQHLQRVQSILLPGLFLQPVGFIEQGLDAARLSELIR
jgi:hypothetical protein